MLEVIDHLNHTMLYFHYIVRFLFVQLNILYTFKHTVSHTVRNRKFCKKDRVRFHVNLLIYHFICLFLFCQTLSCFIPENVLFEVYTVYTVLYCHIRRLDFQLVMNLIKYNQALLQNITSKYIKIHMIIYFVC